MAEYSEYAWEIFKTMFFLEILTFWSYQKSIIRNTENFTSHWYMCLKTDTIPLQYTLHQFRYFITHLCTVDIYQQILQSNSFNGNDLMVLFNWSWSRLINKLPLIKTLNLLASEARISKWSKSIEQLHSRRWSDTADCLTLLRRFPVKLDIPVCSAAIVKCWWHVLP